jgi:hypothetical protein
LLKALVADKKLKRKTKRKEKEQQDELFSSQKI